MSNPTLQVHNAEACDVPAATPPSMAEVGSEGPASEVSATPASTQVPEPAGVFHVVGVGASAGGLEALEELFEALPPDSGMAFVVVQHLSPDFKSHMESLLGRRTAMSVHRVQNGMRVEPNAIYLIPPKMDMVIAQGELLLTAKPDDRALSLPIDQFFRSLARDRGRYAIGVVLSGTGSDGSRGIREIHQVGGLVLAQDASTARFDGMPLSALATGAVDVALPPAAIAEALVKYVQEGLSPEALLEHDLLATAGQGVDRVFALLQRQHGIDFSQYKASTVARRIQRRIDIVSAQGLDDYIDRLQDEPGEVNELYKDLLIGVTKFFRDYEAYEIVRLQLRGIIDRASEQTPVRIWIAGCASGEEAYSLAMLLDEECRSRKKRIEVKIFATDAHQTSLATAARGVYPEESLSEMSPERRARYFRRSRDGYHVTRELRHYIVFAPHNILNDAPFTQMDLVSCRNLLIYLQPSAQRKALALFHFALKPGGVLFLGPSESPGELGEEFSTVDKRWRVFRKVRDVRLPLESRIPMPLPRRSQEDSRFRNPSTGTARPEPSLLGTYDVLLARHMPASLLVNDSFEILHTFAGGEKYLRPKPGRPTHNLLELAHEGLKGSLVGALQHALRKQDAVEYHGLTLPGEDGTAETIQLRVEPILEPKTRVTNLLVQFKAVGEAVPVQESTQTLDATQLTHDRIATLELELKATQENLQATIEEMEASNEELQATNEELTASNEELQSTNEELHSVNEELYTVNAEHQLRLEELARANDDMDNLLATTRVGVIFLDEDLCIRRFTPEIGRLFHLVRHDIGRNIEGFAHHLYYDDLARDLRKVLAQQREVEVNIRSRFGASFLVRMMPYRTGLDVNGVVLTLIDVSSLRVAESSLETFKRVTEASQDMIAVVDHNGRITYANPAMLRGLEREAESLLETNIDGILQGVTFGELSEGAEGQQNGRRLAFFQALGGAKIPVELSISRVATPEQKSFAVTARDVTEQLALKGRLEEMGMMVEASHDAIIVWDIDASILSWSHGATNLYGFTADEALGKNIHELLSTADPDLLARVRDSLATTGHWVGELEQLTKAGERIVVSSRWQVLRTQAGSRRVLEINRDITAKKAAQLALEEANLAANRANQAKSAFLANMSHELRTPLAALLGFAEILVADAADEVTRERAQTIQRNGQYLLALLKDLLDLSKVEAGKLEIRPQAVDLAGFFRELYSLMQVRALEQGVPLRFEFSSELPRSIQIDPVRLRQILVNLISNALKFTDLGEVTVAIRAEVGRPHGRLEICVTDTGVGIDEEQFDSIFSPFSSTSQQTAKRFGGTGLGLSISRRLAESMGGEISVRSKRGAGSSFTLSLPVAEADMSELMRPSEPEFVSPASVLELPAIAGRVLVADDRRDIWRVLKYFLERAGAEVVLAEDGRQAVDAVLRAQEAGQPFSLVLMDIQMPVMTGYEAVVELRRLGIVTPIIALTAHAMEGEREECLKAGCSDYVAKPVDYPKLLWLIHAQLKRSSRPPEGIAGAPFRVLLIEDDEDTASVSALLLERLGAEARCAADGATAIEHLLDFRPNGVLMDLELPDTTGLALARAMRARGFLGPIVALTGHSGDSIDQACREAGIDTVLTKPCDMRLALGELEAAPPRSWRSVDESRFG